MLELSFFTVPPPRSGHVVDLLQTIPAVTEATAVYSGVDVVAIFEGSQSEIDLAHVEIASRGVSDRRC